MTENRQYKIGYQGDSGCYTEKLININFKHEYSLHSYKSFNDLFESLASNKLDYIMTPIENSSGGSIYINYDLFYKYHIQSNFRIVKEYSMQINHCLYINKNASLDDIKYITSHPQALAQCRNSINGYKWETIESWDTAGSISDVLNKGKDYACIAPEGLENYKNNYGIKPIIKNFNDEENNVTRFYLMTNKNSLLNKISGNNCFNEDELSKFSSYLIVNDQIGILGNVLNIFKENDINLTKLESKPLYGFNQGLNNNWGTPFKYIFFIEGLSKYSTIKYITDILNKKYNYNLLGIFPQNDIINSYNIKTSKLNIGIIGYGRFGRFIGEAMKDYGFNIYCTSRTDYTDICKDKGIFYLYKNEFIKQKLDIVILATSILSFKDVFMSFNDEFWKDKLVCDVLSVKEYPFNIMKDKLGGNFLCTHPMFGPDSCHDNNWIDKKFVYEYYNLDMPIYDKMEDFLDFWRARGCKMINMNSIKHDEICSNSQFITHFIGRSLNNINMYEDISTDGFKALLKIKKHTENDSWDLFEALAKYNKNTKKSIHKLLFNLNNIYGKLYSSEIKESPTAIAFKNIEILRKNNIPVINCAAGVPSWTPDSVYNCKYGVTKGDEKLINNILKYYKYSNDYYDNIIITPGAKSGLYMSILYLTKPSSRWIIPKPYWVSYSSMIEICHGQSIFINSSIENKWHFNLEEVEKLFNKKDVNGIIISNPNNPTGCMYNDNFLINLKALCLKYKKYLIVDEVYLPLCNKKTLFNNEDFIIIVNSFSKRWGIPGHRVGWVLSSKKIIKGLIKCQSIMNTCAPTISQEIANNLMNCNYNPNLSILNKSKEHISKLLIKKGWKLVYNPNTSLYLFPYKENENIEVIIKKLLNNNLAVINGDAFGIENAFRMTLWNNHDISVEIYNILDKCL